jgi:hypothetical protein
MTLRNRYLKKNIKGVVTTIQNGEREREKTNQRIQVRKFGCRLKKLAKAAANKVFPQP